MKKLLELENKLKKAKEELLKNVMLGYGDSTAGSASGAGGTKPSIGTQIGWPGSPAAPTEKAEDHKDEEQDKKMIEEEMDEHNEKKHGEPKSVDSAMKSDVVKFEKNGQWSMQKADQMKPKPDGKYDVPVKEVYNGDDKLKERGGKSVDGDKGKTIKVSDKEKKELKEL